MARGGTKGHGPQVSAIEFVRLSHVDTAGLRRLLNDPRVQRHMPLAGDEMTEADVHAWVGNKERHWDELGFGPWGIPVSYTHLTLPTIYSV